MTSWKQVFVRNEIGGLSQLKKNVALFDMDKGEVIAKNDEIGFVPVEDITHFQLESYRPITNAELIQVIESNSFVYVKMKHKDSNLEPVRVAGKVVIKFEQ